MFLTTSLFLLLGVVVRNTTVLGAPSAPVASAENVGYLTSSCPPGITFEQDIVWESCDAFGVKYPLPGLYCSHVKIPMDYHDSSAGTASLAVIKYTATEPGKSKGSIFINPGVFVQRPGDGHVDLSQEGGPGGAGTIALPALAQSLSAIFDGEYDIVSWDPRGSSSFFTLYGLF